MSLISNYEYKCEHFAIEELVPPQVAADRGQRAWQLLDPRALVTQDRLRERYGRMTVNNYKFGGDRQWSGLRTPDSPWYRTYSQHSFGRAFDNIFSDVTVDEVREDILANPDDKTFEYIMRVEMKTSWLHYDVANCKRIVTFNP